MCLSKTREKVIESSKGIKTIKLEASLSFWINIEITAYVKKVNDKDVETGSKKQSLQVKDTPRSGNEKHPPNYNEGKERRINP